MNLEGKKALVTGGAGFIGSAVVKKLLEKGAHVKVLDNLSKGLTSNLNDVKDKIEFVQANMLDPNVCKENLKDIDVCFHFAALIGGIGYFHKHPATILRDNSIMNLNLWDAAKETKPKMVCLSSSMVFERTNIFPTPEKAIDESPPPFSGYGFSKLISEYITRTYYEEFGIPFIIARPFNAYGPGEEPGDYVGYSHVIPDLVKKMLPGKLPIEILGNGEQVRSYTHVNDIADGIIFITENAENNDFNVANGVGTSVLELADSIWKILWEEKPFEVKYVEGFQHDVKIRIPDISKIRDLGWSPKISLEEGLKQTIEWLKPQLSK